MPQCVAQRVEAFTSVRLACGHPYPVHFQVNWEIRSDHVAGDFGFDPLGLKPTDPAELVEMQPGQLIGGA